MLSVGSLFSLEMRRAGLRRALCSFVAGSLVLIVMGTAFARAEVRLLPAPREAQWLGEIDIPEGIRVTVPDEFAARDLEEATAGLEAKSGGGKDGFPVVLLRAGSAEGKSALAETHLALSPEMAAEGYVLVINPKRAFIVAESSTGIFLRRADAEADASAGGHEDSTAFGNDSRLARHEIPRHGRRSLPRPLPHARIPKAPGPRLRVFQSQYLHAVFRTHPRIPESAHGRAARCSSMSPADVAELVRYAAQYHVSILPEQEAFGHLHHVLKYEIYEGVAETPHGQVLAPGQSGSVPPHSRLVHSDRQGVSVALHAHRRRRDRRPGPRAAPKTPSSSRGYGPVYVQFLTQIHDALAPLHRRLLFWGDIGGADPAAVSKLPRT